MRIWFNAWESKARRRVKTEYPTNFIQDGLPSHLTVFTFLINVSVLKQFKRISVIKMYFVFPLKCGGVNFFSISFYSFILWSKNVIILILSQILIRDNWACCSSSYKHSFAHWTHFFVSEPPTFFLGLVLEKCLDLHKRLRCRGGCPSQHQRKP